MKLLLTLACATMIPVAPVTAEDIQRTVVILLDPAAGSVSQVVVAPISGSSTELLDLLLARLVDAEKRVEVALATGDPEGLREQLDEAIELARDDQRRLEVLNRQVAALRGQVGGLQDLLGVVRMREEALIAEIDALSVELNATRARIADEARASD